MDARPANDDLFHALAALARATSDGTLVTLVIVGLTAAIVVAVPRPPAWLLLASAGVCAAAFGAWGIADRELAERTGTSGRATVNILRGVRLLALLGGTCAAIVFVFRVLGAALGTWIS
ncbi:MAG TPA: hypothetical protein VFS59_04125 [Gemmatimonadaceae bacterium]|nr:hypothetical protein [Gemmatimonadaceae bacterium]